MCSTMSIRSKEQQLPIDESLISEDSCISNDPTCYICWSDDDDNNIDYNNNSSANPNYCLEMKNSIIHIACCPRISYHHKCLSKWLSIQKTCPFCRSNVNIIPNTLQQYIDFYQQNTQHLRPTIYSIEITNTHVSNTNNESISQEIYRNKYIIIYGCFVVSIGIFGYVLFYILENIQ